MNAKAGFFAIFLTVFTLGLIGGVAKAAMNFNQSANPTSTPAAEVVQADYQVPTAAQPTDVPPTQPAPTQAQIPAEQASQAALQAAGDGETIAAIPEMVMFNGAEAYEVKLQDGNALYIGAIDGKLIYNSITGSDKPVVTSEQALIIAADYINYYQPVSIALQVYNEKPAYFIRFWNGANVYVDRAGNILAVQYVQYTSSNSSSAAPAGSNSGSSSGGSSGSEGEHESDND
jgi:uncharacterized membrane protein YgcG